MTADEEFLRYMDQANAKLSPSRREEEVELDFKKQADFDLGHPDWIAEI